MCNSTKRWVNRVEEADSPVSLETEVDNIVIEKGADSEPEYVILSI